MEVGALEILRKNIEAHLTRIEKLLPSEYRLTLIVRHAKNNNSHICLTLDDPKKVIGAIEKLWEGELVNDGTKKG